MHNKGKTVFSHWRASSESIAGVAEGLNVTEAGRTSNTKVSKHMAMAGTCTVDPDPQHPRPLGHQGQENVCK